MLPAEGRPIGGKDLAYDRISEDWASFVDLYDTRRRIEVLVEEFLGPDLVAGATCLDAGCGLGYFTRALLRLRPSSLTSIDISPSLVERIARECAGVEGVVADLMELRPALGDRVFDVVLSSEVVEHTPDPRRAVANLAARVAPGGVLAISCPNSRWKWLLHVAEALRVRKPYEGYENWVAPAHLVRWVEEAGLHVTSLRGIHCLPWHVSRPVVNWLDTKLAAHSFPFAVNLALLAKRESRP